MIGICKILFDMCFYYALSGYFLYLITQSYPSVWGVPVLMLAVIAYMLTTRGQGTGDRGQGTGDRGQGARERLFSSRIDKVKQSQASAGKDAGSRSRVSAVSVICCLLPALLLVFRPAIAQIVQFLPAWVFLGFTMWNGLIHTDRRSFEHHFQFTGMLFLLMFFGIIAINTGRIGPAVSGAIPYIIVYMLTGVCLMRILREDGRLAKSRNVIVLIVMLVGSVVLAGLQTPQLVLGVIGFIYRNVITWILTGAAFGVGAVIYVIIEAFRRLFSFLRFGGNETAADGGGVGPDINEEPIEAFVHGFPPWVGVVATVLLVLAVAYVIFVIMRRMLGSRVKEDAKELYTEEREHIKPRGRSIKNRILRPKDPRLAIRWYYCKYLKEGTHRRGRKHYASDTSLNILKKYRPYFSGREAEDLRELYITARYQGRKEVHKSEADAASDLWNNLKRSSTVN